jgi:hypothetical protein
MKSLIATTAFLLLGAASVLSVTAQSGQRGRMMHNYDPKTEVTLTGTVESIDRAGYANIPRMGVHLILKTGNETTEVHLGPAAFVDRKMTFKKDDTVQITGSKVTMMGRMVVIAREVKKGGEVLKLRDENGVPLQSRGQMPIS